MNCKTYASREKNYLISRRNDEKNHYKNKMYQSYYGIQFFGSYKYTGAGCLCGEVDRGYGKGNGTFYTGSNSLISRRHPCSDIQHNAHRKIYKVVKAFLEPEEMSLKMKKHKDKKSKFSLWSLVLWNMSIWGVLFFVFGKLLLRRFIETSARIEELFFLVLIPVFLIVNIKQILRNVKKLYLSYRESSPDEIVQNEPETDQYAFMNMYQKLSRRRMCMPLIFPLLCIGALAVFFPILSRGIFSWQSVLMLFNHRPIQFAFLPAVLIPLFISLKIYRSSNRNLDMLQQVYDCSQRQEIEAINSIKEKQAAYVFTGDFLINWDGSLNIVPLKEIKKIEYIKYFYLFLYGTRLRIRCDKKYVLWAYGPSGTEWVARGFILPDGQSEKSVSYEINLPV